MVDVAAFDALLLTVLPPEHVFAVGGRVRDEIRAQNERTKLVLKDADYVVTGMPLPALISALQTHGRVDQVGASFSVIKFTRDGQTVDIALPRREYSTGAGHRDFTIEAGPDIPLEDDLGRRDFRMNMIARSIASGRIVDPYDGTADILARRIDIVAEATFEEDPLRMLRACQFAARFEYTLSKRAHAAIGAAHELIRSVSPQRLGEEMSKLLRLAQRPSLGLELMRETGLLHVIWPELLEGYGMEQNDWHAYDVYRHNLETLDSMPMSDLVSRLTALLHDVGKPRVKDGPHFYRHEHVGATMVHGMLERIAMPNEVVETTAHLVRHHMYSSDPVQTDAAIRRFIKRVGSKHLERLFALRAADICGSGLPKRNGDNELFQMRVERELAARRPLAVSDLAMSGNDIVQEFVRLGASPEFRGDKRVGIVLQHLLDFVLDSPEQNTRAILFEQASKQIAHLLQTGAEGNEN